MRRPHFLHATLRIRFLLGMGIMLLPLVLLALGAFFSLQSAVGALDDVAQETSGEIALVLNIQTLIQRASLVVHHNLIAAHGDPGGADRFHRISQQALEDLSIHDGLTGLFNYREFHRRLTEEAQRSRRYGRPFSLLILDIDGFKAVNDTYGHLAGDEALRGLASLIRRAVRPVDDVARYGGEEFAILLPETPAPGALAMAERIRDIIATHPMPIGPEKAVTLTVSIGAATYPEDADAEEKLIAAAHRALYAAKNSGRNRVCRWGKSRANARPPGE